MTCRFSTVDGMCAVFDSDAPTGGTDETGICVCEDDPDPLLMCEEYEDKEVQK